jgi:hypothetical protein
MKYIIFLIVIVGFFSLSDLSFSLNKMELKTQVNDVNNFSVKKLGISLEEIYYLYYFHEHPFQSSSILESHLSKDAVKQLMSKSYLEISESSNPGFELIRGETIKEITLTKKGKYIVESLKE